MESREPGSSRGIARFVGPIRPPRVMVRLILALAVAGSVAAPAFMAAAQSSDNSPRKHSFVEEASRLGPPGMASCTAKGTVRQVYLGLSRAFKDFTDDERCHTAVIAVRERGGDSTADIIAFARAGIGGLMITSDPAGASIWVNGLRLEGTTLTRAITTVGEKSVRLSLAGYADETGTIIVVPGKWVPFHRDLRKP